MISSDNSYTQCMWMFIMFRAVYLIVVVLSSYCDGLILDNVDKRNCSNLLNIPLEQRMYEDYNDQLSGHSCPPWFTNETGDCLPGPTLGGIIQQDTLTLQTSLLECYCMTEKDGVLAVGACLYTCKAVMGYYPLPCRVSQLQNFTCGDLHRHGQLCGECEEGYAIPVYSYDLGCVKCEDYEYNWLKYLAVAFLPLTLFYTLVALLSISFTSPSLSGLVLGIQMVAHPVELQVFVSVINSTITVLEPKLLEVLLSLASFWNLDFFRMYYSFCLHPKASAMAIMALDYATTVYPVLLITITYVMVKLYDQNFKLLVWPWKAVSVILKPLRNVRTSLVDVFASFIYLSSTRLLVTSMNFLVPITIYSYMEETGGLTTKHYLFNSPSAEYFSKGHLPFALMAITLSFVFFALPMVLLFVYPFAWFQKILNIIGLNSLTLRTFMEVYQGYFKDGTNNTRDFRFFAGFLFLVPLILNLTFLLTKSSMYYPIGSVWIPIYLTLHLVFRPYKRSLHNHITVWMLVALLAYYWGMTINNEVLGMVLGGCGDSTIFNGVFLIAIALIIFSIFILLLYVLGLLCVLASMRICPFSRSYCNNSCH